MAEPLVKLEPTGQAQVLSYNVPEPTSYTGRSFINLELDGSYFKEGNSLHETHTGGPALISLMTGPEALRLRTRGESSRYRMVETSEALRALEGREVDLTTLGGEKLGSKLLQVDADEVRAMEDAGYRLNVYRSMYGHLTYNFVRSDQEIVLPAGQGLLLAPAHPHREPNGDPLGSEGEETFVISVHITSPANGDTITGPTSGVTLNISGSAELGPPSGHPEVEVRLGSGPFKAATRAGVSWSRWTFSSQVTSAGPLTITARGQARNPWTNKIVRSTAEVTVLVSLTNPGSTPDTTPPELSVTTPKDDATYSGLSTGVPIAVQGTASDDVSGVKLVEVTLDHDENRYVAATPQAPNDWSTWSAQMIVTAPGAHMITVRCTDNANNAALRSVPISILTRPPRRTRKSRLLLVEIYRLSSYLGNYGAGRVIKTFSLLPGEKTKISVKSYTRQETSRKDASTILDSFSEESAEDFETTLGNEQANKQEYDESFNYKVGAEASVGLGFFSASITGEVSGGTNAAREAFAKTISNSVQKHVAKASAKREVQVNTSYEVREQTGEETSIEREIENINLSRTLNFVFRQMNQEFITILHLVDVRLAYYREEIDETISDPNNPTTTYTS
jgi:Bacterial Ig domain